MLRRLLLQPIDDLATGLDRQVGQAKRRGRAVAMISAAAVVCWFVYVPIHELLHAAGCWVTGGAVSELQIAPHYGGALLARVFPFVVCGGDYAGRLSGFDTHGSDLVYLATVFAPFLLTVIVGVPLLRAVARRAAPAWFGVAVVVGLAPLYNILGDYYEMGSILVTRLAGGLSSGGAAYAGIRGDDVFLQLERAWTAPAELGWQTPGAARIGLALIGVSFVVGVLLALVTYWGGLGVARVWPGRDPATVASEQDDCGTEGSPLS